MMKILWITNSLFPEALSRLCGQNDLKGSGGWMLGLAGALQKTGKVKLIVAGVTTLVKKVTRIEGEQVTYYAIPLFSADRRYDVAFERVYKEVYNQVQPDVVHIHGTEFPHSLAALRACGAEHTVVSLQGMASIISQYYLAGLSYKDILCKPTLHDLMRMSLFQEKREMGRRGHVETHLIEEASYIIGRTSWDRSHVWAINPQVKYFHCNEVLREEFYTGDIWEFNKCKPHSIFLSQGSYPLKGLHKVLEALPLIKRSYPDVLVRVAGPDITYGGAGFKERLKISTYGRIVKDIIRKNDIVDNVVFLGPLNAEQMKQEYLNANIFVCPSSIENSPNSLGEAQIIGVPCVASYAGGIPDFMQGNMDGLYRYEETEILAKKVCHIFENSSAIDNSNMIKQAINRHAPGQIANDIMNIYNVIINNKCVDYEGE